MYESTATTFNPRRWAEFLVLETPVACSAGGNLHVYKDGAHRPGERELRERITLLLGDEWSRKRSEEVLGFLRDSSPLLRPPPPDRINCRNGIFNLETDELEPHDPQLLSSVQIGASFDPEATCPVIDRFLGQVLDPALIEVFYEIAGHWLTPDNSLQIALMALGSGGNGKTTALKLLEALVGPENVAHIALHKLDEDKFAVAELEGKLVNIFADLDRRALQSSSIFKAIVGGDSLFAERKYRDGYSLTPFARLGFSANEPPPTPDGSDAFFRRWLILPFERQFDSSSADRNLIDKLTTPTELSGLLNHALRALPGLRERGAFTRTDVSEKAAERFRVDSDSVSGFLEEACTLDPEARTLQSRLFDAYRNWCTENNRGTLGKQSFNRRVEELRPTLTRKPMEGKRLWMGIKVEGSS